MGGDSPAKDSPNVKKLNLKRAAVKRKITNAFTKFDQDSNPSTGKACAELVESLMRQIEEFDCRINEQFIQTCLDAEELSDEYAAELDRQSEYAFEIRNKLSVISQTSTTSTGSVPPPDAPIDKTPSNCRLKLPEIKCDYFSGEGTSPLEYHTFISKFNNLIGLRTDIKTTTKFTYLFTYLKGYALKLVQHLQITAENYQVALDLLAVEFLNKGAIIHDLLAKLLELKPKSDNCYLSVKIFINEVRCVISDLKIYDVDLVEVPSALTLASHIVFSKLPPLFRQELVRKIANNYPTISDIFNHYIEIINTLNIRSSKPVDKSSRKDSVPAGNKPSGSSSKPFSQPFINRAAAVDSSSSNPSTSTDSSKPTERKNCKFCSATGHSMLNCVKYANHNARVTRCGELKLCKKCTSRKHTDTDCKPLHFSCSVCKSNDHISALCSNYTPGIAAKVCLNASHSSGSTFLLPILTVSVGYGTNKTSINCLFDTGSQRSYISSDVLESLNIEDNNKSTYLINTFIQSAHKPFTESCLTINLDNKYVSVPLLIDDSFNLSLNINGLEEAHDNITSQYKLAGRPLTNEVHLNGLLGIDVIQYLDHCDMVPCLGGMAFNLSTGIIPFGNIDNFLTTEQLVKKYSTSYSQLQAEEPKVDSTAINFVLQPIKTGFDPIGSVLTDSAVEDRLDRMFKLESLGIPEDSCDDDLKKVDEFDSNISFSDGHYEIKLPWNEKIDKVKSNFHISKSILDKVTANLEQRNLYDAYNAVFEQQVRDGILEELPLSQIDVNDHVWIPHRPVVKLEDQVTSKVRPVLNCSLKIGDSPSLNEACFPGINLMNNLLELLIKIRSDSFLVMGDIKQAFLMIKLKDVFDKNKFSILWKTKNNELKAFRYKSIVFGAVSSPFILHHVIKHHLSKYPNDFINEILTNNFYVDNLFFTSSDPDALINTYQQVRQRMSEGGFQLRSWASNSQVVSQQLVSDEVHSSHQVDYEKVLGYRYYPSSDQLAIADTGKISSSDTPATKRSVLSALSSVFDPLGLVTPVMVRGKLLMRDLWREGAGWDDPLSAEHLATWNRLEKDISLLHNIKFNRKASENNTTLIIYTDASKDIYGFSCFAQCKNDDNVETNLIFSKCKSAPTKSKTLPTLELLAVFLACKCLPTLLASMKNVVDVVFCIDSQIVISWILSGKVKSKNVFANNRIRDITGFRKDILDKFGLNCYFSYVPTDLNPADLLTRGLSVSEFEAQMELWVHGPAYIQTIPIEFPSKNLGSISDSNKLLMSNIISNKVETLFPIEKFSNLNKTFRITSLILKFVFLKCKKSVSRERLMNLSKLYWLKTEQARHFDEELTFLSSPSDKQVPKIVNDLNLFRDSKGLIRSKGRIDNSPHDYDVCNPVLLPKQSFLTELVVWDFHHRCHHLGTATTLNSVRLGGYWIPRGRAIIRRILDKCITCKKLNVYPFKYPKPHSYPVDKVNFSRPYQHVGIDFTGHIFIKSGSSHVKMYLLVFACLNIRAIHLELIPDMSCASFLLAFTRFCNFYSIPEAVYSDNASTFLQAMGVLSKSKANDDFESYLLKNNIRHVRIPLYSAWVGAHYERMIKTIKSCLYKVIGRQHMDYFQAITLFSDIQQSINSRPLTYRNNDDHSYRILTPNSFLQCDTGRSLVFSAIPGEEVNVANRRTLVKVLDAREALFDKFKELWRDEYLLSLREVNRNMFQTDWNNRIKVNDIVLIASPMKHRSQWIMGRITELLPGSDGIVRCVKLIRPDGSDGVFSINQLYPLELSSSSEPNDLGSVQQVEASPSRPRRQAAMRCLERINSYK